MGALIPIGGGADGEIKALLNSAFSPNKLGILRTIVAGENIFDSDHKLHRIAYRLGTYPIGNYPGDNAKGKWFYFLKIVLNVSTTESIKKILSYAIKNSTSGKSVKRVVFDAIQGTDATADHYVDSRNPLKPSNQHLMTKLHA